MTPIVPDAIWSGQGKRLGREIHVFDSLESTNTLALSRADDPTNDGLVLLARAQTAGRGQYGRSWQAPPESSVLLSTLLFPPITLLRPPLLTAWAAVSVCETILKLTQLQAKIKWPNDILLRGKKVCGILIEQRTTGNPDYPLASVAGIGLNVSQSASDFADAGLPDAVSLAGAVGQTLAYEAVARELVQQLDEHYHRLLTGDLGTLESLWKWRLGLLGKQVLVEGTNQLHRGRLLDATFTGIHLEIDRDDTLELPPESIRHLHEDPEA